MDPPRLLLAVWHKSFRVKVGTPGTFISTELHGETRFCFFFPSAPSRSSLEGKWHILLVRTTAISRAFVLQTVGEWWWGRGEYLQAKTWWDWLVSKTRQKEMSKIHENFWHTTDVIRWNKSGTKNQSNEATHGWWMTKLPSSYTAGICPSVCPSVIYQRRRRLSVSAFMLVISVSTSVCISEEINEATVNTKAKYKCGLMLGNEWFTCLAFPES